MRLCVGMPAREATKTTRIVIGRHEEQAVGMIVDAVLAVRAVPQRLIETASPLFAARINMDYIKGLARLDDGVVTLLDPDRLLRKPGAPDAPPELNGNAS
jgi:purine-binding chemotaxis protein CheW